MGSQWEFYKIAWKSAVSINNQAKTFLEDQLDRVLYFMKNSVWVPRREFWLNLYYLSQWPKTTLNGQNDAVTFALQGENIMQVFVCTVDSVQTTSITKSYANTSMWIQSG